MSQLYAQLIVPPHGWIVGGPENATQVMLLQPAVVKYTDGTSDTLPALTPAVLPDGTNQCHRGSFVWTPYTVKGSDVLSVCKESDLGTLTSSYAVLGRVSVHQVEPYQPDAYLGTAASTPTTTVVASSAAGQGTVLDLGAGGAEPTGWTTAGFNDSAWAVAVAANDPLTPIATTQWISYTSAAGSPINEDWLHRRAFAVASGATGGTVQIAADNFTIGCYVNGTLIGGGATVAGGSFAIPSGVLLPGQINILAVHAKNDASSGSGNPTAICYTVTVTQQPGAILTNQGSWNPTATYQPGHTVTDNGSTWTATTTNTNSTPSTSSTTWTQVGTTSALQVLNVRQAPYNAKGDGTTDDTAAIQAAINAVAAAGGGTVYLPAGIYQIGGALQDPGGANAQLLFPARNVTTAQPLTIALVGASAPPQIPSELGTVVTPTVGTILRSSLTAGTGGALIGCANGSTFSMLEAVLQNLTLRLPSNPVLSAANLALAAAAEVIDVMVDTGSYDLLHMAQPTTASSYGVQLPGNNNGAWTYVNRLSVVGFYTGVLLGEHTVADEVGVWTCQRAIEAPVVYHASLLHRVLVVWCPTGLYVSGAHALHVTQWDVEHHNGGGWYDAVSDVDDATNQATGALSWWAVQANVGVQNSFVLRGGAGLLCTRLGAADGGGAGTVTSVALTVPADETVTGSPLTAAGTLAITRKAQSGNTALLSPADGSSGAPAYRALEPADLPVATTTALGAVTPDGATLTIAGGVLSVIASGPHAGELLVQDGVTAPPVALYAEDGTDFLSYG